MMDEEIDTELGVGSLDEEIPEHALRAMRKVAGEYLKISTSTDKLQRRFGRYFDDPMAFFRNELGIEPWESEDPEQHGQADLVRAVGKHDRVGCKSGHKIGKSVTAVGLALWFVCTRRRARVLLTAPTFSQVKNILWREMRRLYKDQNLTYKLDAEIPLDPSTGLKLDNGNEVVGISTKTKENLAGWSDAEMFFIVDEGSGFPDDLWEVLSKGNAAGGVKIFVISNPTRAVGWFFELFRRRLSRWKLFTISSENTPNVRAGKKIVPGLCERDFILEMREACGPDYENDPTYMVRVRGEFPPQGSDAVVGVQQVERAVARWKDEPPAAELASELVLGVDCARYGNDANVIQPVRGLYAYEPREVDTTRARRDPKLTAGKLVADAVVTCARELRLGNELVRVNVDGLGVGASVVDFLKESDEVREGWIYVVDMNVGENADEQTVYKAGDEKVRTHYFNLRSQLWFGVAAWLHEGGALPDHERLQAELLCASYTFDDRGRKKVEKKDKMRVLLGGRSPDHADALCLATYRGERGAVVKFEYTPAGDHRAHANKTVVPATYNPWDHWNDDD